MPIVSTSINEKTQKMLPVSTNENRNQRENALVSTNENAISQKTFFVSTRLDKYIPWGFCDVKWEVSTKSRLKKFGFSFLSRLKKFISMDILYNKGQGGDHPC